MTKWTRMILQSVGAVLGFGIVTPAVSGFGGFLTTSIPGFTGLSLAGVGGAFLGVWGFTFIAEKLKQ